MKKVLIITYSFPPLNNVTASQYREIAFYMPKFGWQPFILTTKSKGELSVKIPEDNIIRIGKNFESNKITVYEKDDRGLPNVLKPFYFLYKKCLGDVRSIDRFLFSWGKDVLNNIELIKKINPDVIIATNPPVVSLWLGHIFSKKIKKPWLADLRDPCSLSNTSKFSFTKFLDRKIDKFLLKSAAGIITVGPYLASLMEDFYRKPVKVIYNGFDKFEITALKRNASKKKKNKIIYHAGIFYPHRLPSVELLIDWLASNKKDNFRFIIRSKGPLRLNKEILKYAKEKKVSQRIDLLNPAPPEVIYQEKKKADILVLFEDLKGLMPVSRGTMTGKLFEYLPFRAPIIAIAQENSDMDGVLKDTSRGYLVSNANSLDIVMKNILKGDVPNPDWEKVKDYSRKSQCKILCNLLNQII